MKNRQFIVLCCLIVIGFCVLYIQNDRNQNQIKANLYDIQTVQWMNLLDQPKALEFRIQYMFDMVEHLYKESWWDIDKLYEKKS